MKYLKILKREGEGERRQERMREVGLSYFRVHTRVLTSVLGTKFR